PEVPGKVRRQVVDAGVGIKAPGGTDRGPGRAHNGGVVTSEEPQPVAHDRTAEHRAGLKSLLIVFRERDVQGWGRFVERRTRFAVPARIIVVAEDRSAK